MTDCYHEWQWTKFYYCMCCDFNKTHGNLLSQCIKCGKLWESENGFFIKEEIENFKFNGIEIPHIIEISPLEADDKK